MFCVKKPYMLRVKDPIYCMYKTLYVVCIKSYMLRAKDPIYFVYKTLFVFVYFNLYS